ncbi:anchored repeat-type ABC transporter ATP-binding subunit [Glaciihabitans sp. INWT7]|uniref:anchored repeat-type ABC transporter ATP-binding subunit n=1 Tax=Glaciihabitans sp. INWT7 TaxID=2596912 RepID=UPI0021082CFF|nr:anchored repeat-type ABC transporter ATP-binding subunit [Glaciihabitans sp. INWT7]
MSFSIDAGELVGLIGPNGAGKTTLLRSLLALVRRRAGAISVLGTPAKRGRSSVGYVPQRHEFAWDFPISVERAVLTGRVKRIGWTRQPGLADWRAVRDAIDRVGITDLHTRPVEELSGGQRQRVLVARALALEPTVLLLDEPFTGLDVPTQELLTDLFVDLAREGEALLMTTHDLGSAVATCDRLLLVNQTIIADATPAELSSADAWKRTFGVRDSSPLLTSVGVR